MLAHNNLPRWAMSIWSKSNLLIPTYKIQIHVFEPEKILRAFFSVRITLWRFDYLEMDTHTFTCCSFGHHDGASPRCCTGKSNCSRQTFSEQRSVTVGATNKSAKERFTHLLLHAMNITSAASSFSFISRIAEPTTIGCPAARRGFVIYIWAII